MNARFKGFCPPLLAHQEPPQIEGTGRCGQTKVRFFFYFTANNYCQGSQASFRGLLHAAFSTSTSLGFNNPQNRAWCLVFGVFDLPGLQPPSTCLNNPQNRAWYSFPTSLGFDNPQQPPKSSTMLGFWGVFDLNLPPHPSTTPEIERSARFQPPWALTTLDNPRNRVWCSVLGVFDLPGLQPPSTTPKIERDARFWGFSTFLGFNLPPWSSTTPETKHDAPFWEFSTSLLYYRLYIVCTCNIWIFVYYCALSEFCIILYNTGPATWHSILPYAWFIALHTNSIALHSTPYQFYSTT